MNFRDYLTCKTFLIFISIVTLCTLFVPVPKIQTMDVACSPCFKQTGYTCPTCPKKGDITWNQSIINQLLQNYLYSPSIQPAGLVLEETPTPSPRMEKLPWENATCGNGVCELCESSDSCCNYPPKKDKNGTMVYPPPTCMGQCAQDCKSGTEKKVVAPFPLDDPTARYYIESNYLRYESQDDPKHPIGIGISQDTTISWQQFRGKDIVVKGEFIMQTEQVECTQAPCPPLDFTVIRIDSIQLR